MQTPVLLGILAAICVLGGAACRRPTPSTRPATPPPATSSSMVPGNFITKPGSLIYHGGHGIVRLDLSRSGDRVNWDLVYSGSAPGRKTYGSGMSLAAPDCETWFLYMEDELTFWIYDGGSVLRYFSMEAGGAKSGSVMRDGKLEQDAPKPPLEVILRLPPDQQKLFPPVPAPAARPSI